MEWRDEIDIDEATDRCHVEFEQPTPIAYPHVVDENVKPPVLCADAVERLANGRFIGNVEQAGDGGPASRSDHGHRPLWPFRTAPIGEHERTRPAPVTRAIFPSNEKPGNVIAPPLR